MSWVVLTIFGVILLFGFVVFRGAPYVPSHRRQVERAFRELRPLGAADLVVDAGSGDGIVLRMASLRGARALGYELNPVLVLISRILSRHDHRVTVRVGDFWRVSFPDATTVIYGFSVGRDIDKMASKIQAEANRLGKPLDFISYGLAVSEREPIRQLGAHYLYRFEPLQQDEA